MELLWTDFLNSDWHDWRTSGRSEDLLDRPAWFSEFTAQWRLSAAVPPEAEEIAALRRFRAFLLGMVQTLVAGGAPGPDDLRRLNEIMAGGPVVRQISASDQGYRQDFTPLRQDWGQVMAEVAASFAQTLTEGEPGRVRICDNPDCLWVFYDDTRNRTKRFCNDKLCGNLMKVRRFRARRKDSGHGSEG